MYSLRSAPLLAALAGAVALFALPLPVAAQSGPELYADANRLNREGLTLGPLARPKKLPTFGSTGAKRAA